MSPMLASEKESVLSLDRCIRARNDGQLRQRFLELLDEDAPVITLDLSRLESIDAPTVHFILLLWERLRQTGRRMRLRGLKEEVFSILHRLKIDRYIHCQP